MKSLVPFLLARLSERSTRAQLLVLGVTGAVAAGLVTTEQVGSFTQTLVGMAGVIGPLVAIALPDKDKPVPPEAVANAALAAAQAAAAKVPGFEGVQRDVEAVAAAAEDAFHSTLAGG